MRKKAIIAGAILIAILLLGSILFIGAPPSSPPITVRHIKSVQSGDHVTATFEITNHTARNYSVYPVSVEARNGSVWKTCSDFSSYSFPIDDLGPHGSESRTFEMSNWPTGSPLRFRLTASERLTGLKARLTYFEWSLVNHKNLLVPLNPFQTNFSFPRTIEIVSEEFIEPEANQ